MKVLVIGGTQFVGRRTVRELKDNGHDVAVLHRGKHEPSELADVVHIHGDRNDLTVVRSEVDAFAPDLVWDNTAMSSRQAEQVIAVLGAREYVVTSSVDVYKAYGAFLDGSATEPVPIDETAPLRTTRYPYKGRIPGMDEYDKLDVEAVYAAVDATIVRWPTVYGPHDDQRREEYVLCRVRAGRTRIPIGSGSWLKTRAFCDDIAAAMRLTIEEQTVRGEILNLGERATFTMHQWTQMILDAAGSQAELVRVADDSLPSDLVFLGNVPQHVTVDSGKAHRMLGLTDTDPWDALKISVGWHLAHPPSRPKTRFDPDDAALAD